MSLASGTRLGAYQVLTCIGAGGMGEVYKAVDTRLGRTVALKIIREPLRMRGNGSSARHALFPA